MSAHDRLRLTPRPDDPAALVAPERDPAGAAVAGLGARADKHGSVQSVPVASRPFRMRWLAPVAVAAVVAVAAGSTWALTSRPGSTTATTVAQPPEAVVPVQTTTSASPSDIEGALAGFEGQYGVTIDDVALVTMSGSLVGATTQLVYADGTVQFSYVNGANSGSANVPVIRAPLVVSGCGSDTCVLDGASSVPMLLHDVDDRIVVASFTDITPVGRMFCGLAGPEDTGIVEAVRGADGVVSSFSYVMTVGSGFGGADGCTSTWLASYRVVATRE